MKLQKSMLTPPSLHPRMRKVAQGWLILFSSILIDVEFYDCNRPEFLTIIIKFQGLK